MSEHFDRPPYKVPFKRTSFSVQPVMRDGRWMMVRVEKRAIPCEAKQEAEPLVPISISARRSHGPLAKDVMHLLRTRPRALWSNKR